MISHYQRMTIPDTDLNRSLSSVNKKTEPLSKHYTIINSFMFDHVTCSVRVCVDRITKKFRTNHIILQTWRTITHTHIQLHECFFKPHPEYERLGSIVCCCLSLIVEHMEGNNANEFYSFRNSGIIRYTECKYGITQRIFTKLFFLVWKQIIVGL